MCDTAGHLAEHAQFFLTHYCVLCLAQVLVSDLQSAMESRLKYRQPHMFTQLLEKLAFATAETVCLATSSDENAEDLAFHQERRGHQCPQTAGEQPLREREWHLPQVGLVHQLTTHAARQAVLIDLNTTVLGKANGACHLEGVSAQPRHRHMSIGRFIQADTAEIERQLFFQRVDHDLENAGEIVALGDRAGYAVQQM